MTVTQISRYICVLLLMSSVGMVPARAAVLRQDSVTAVKATSDSVTALPSVTLKGKHRKVTVALDSSAVRRMKEIRDSVRTHAFLRGFAVYAELGGALGKVFNWDNIYYEAGLRINLKQTYFPAVEVGYSDSDCTNDLTGIAYRTKAPYFRVGMDYNFLRNKESGNRLFGGVRVGYSKFDYTIMDPTFTDPVWNTPVTYDYSYSSDAIWTEFLFGLEAKVWSAFHLGWSVRYKVRWSQKTNESGEPYYIPGFGLNDNTRLGATFYVAIDI